MLRKRHENLETLMNHTSNQSLDPSLFHYPKFVVKRIDFVLFIKQKTTPMQSFGAVHHNNLI